MTTREDFLDGYGLDGDGCGCGHEGYPTGGGSDTYSLLYRHARGYGHSTPPLPGLYLDADVEVP